MHLTRREILSGGAAVALTTTAGLTQPQRRLFDSHCPIIDHRFPIVANQGYTPPRVPARRLSCAGEAARVAAGAVVSGSFQAVDQSFLMDVLPKLGAGWVGVTQLPTDYPDAEIGKLASSACARSASTCFAAASTASTISSRSPRRVPLGRRLALRNLRRCRGAQASCRRAVEAAATFRRSSRHDRGRRAGVLELVEAGCKVKATGFGASISTCRRHWRRRQEQSERAGVRHRHSLDAPTAVRGIRHRAGRARAGRRTCAARVLGQSVELYRVKVA